MNERADIYSFKIPIFSLAEADSQINLNGGIQYAKLSKDSDSIEYYENKQMPIENYPDKVAIYEIYEEVTTGYDENLETGKDVHWASSHLYVRHSGASYVATDSGFIEKVCEMLGRRVTFNPNYSQGHGLAHMEEKEIQYFDENDEGYDEFMTRTEAVRWGEREPYCKQLKRKCI